MSRYIGGVVYYSGFYFPKPTKKKKDTRNFIYYCPVANEILLYKNKASRAQFNICYVGRIK